MTLIKFIDHIISWIGRLVSWLTFLLVLIIVGDVLLRYLFSVTSSASFELEWHLFATIFLIGAAWTLQADRHVRVDVFYNSFPQKVQAWINLTGTVLLLFPFCLVGISEGSQFAYNAYQLGEVSPDPGGLPFRFIIKSTIPAGFFLLFLQGINEGLKSIVKIKTSN